MVRDLRERTGAGMMDCKAALEATQGDMEAAIDHLRKKGLQKAEKKASRAMGEGRVYAKLAADGRSGALIAVTCETDFMAKTKEFEAFLEALATHVLASGATSPDDVLAQRWSSGGTVSDAVKGVIASLGENMSISGARRLSNPAGWIGAYVHHDGKQGAMVSVTSTCPRAKSEAALKAVCQQIVVHAPPFAKRAEVPAADIEREKDIHREIQEKILAGKLEKFFADKVLPEQPWIHDDKKSVAVALVEALGKGSSIEAFVGFKVGG
jgi:elongation factor Ts